MLSFALALAITFASPFAHAQSAPPAAPSHRPESPLRKKSALVWGGSTLFAAAYITSALVATTGYPADDSMASSRVSLWVPAVGPFVMMGTTKYASLDLLLVLDGLAQIGGISMFVYGLTSTPSAARPEPARALTLTVAPVAVRGGAGAAIVGAF